MPNNFFYDPRANSSATSTSGTTNNSGLKTIASTRTTTYIRNYQYDYEQQALKNFHASLRMSLSVTYGGQTTTFKAHIDPNHLINEQGKRLIQIDTLQGIIIQDFGYVPELIELKGTTGSAYYKEIQTLDTIFNNQSNQGENNAVTLSIESRVYNVVWKSFTFDRMQTAQGGNLINYTMNFIVLNRTANNYRQDIQTIVKSKLQSNVSNNFSNGQRVVDTVLLSGQTITQFVQMQSSIPLSQNQKAIQWIINNNTSMTLLPNVTYNNVTISIPDNWTQALSSS